MRKNKVFKENLLELLNQDDDVKDFLDQMITKKVEDVFMNFLVKDDYHDFEKEGPTDNIEFIIHNKIQKYFYNIYMDINHLREEKIVLEMEELQNQLYENYKLECEIEETFEKLEQSGFFSKSNFYDNLIPKNKVSSSKELAIIFDYLIKEKMILGNFIDFSSFCEKSFSKKPLNWIDKKGYNAKSKAVTYVLLFDLLHNVIFQEPKHFEGLKRQMFLKNICEGFLFDGDKKNFNQLNTAYSTWRNEHRLTESFL
ncbi:hypothetical protein H1R17_10590 [Flavobacterium sp. xlx-214]|uniref:hypothetical protein n=1 Tax=unclassified Flavobacterium TaxID=196869 RepID=UPI0013D2BEF8|nr:MULTISPECIES: hypothetical protein [unclassified Flavobacterium]MBA5791663.1 hypothetical protein [Flavobacterium sp. xlx-221]QMI82906.1 hypothetical protein H1R17_10590 [Flavobacterium sp. xlx-214]